MNPESQYAGDTRETFKLCVSLLSSAVKQSGPTYAAPIIVDALAACNRWLAINPPAADPGNFEKEEEDREDKRSESGTGTETESSGAENLAAVGTSRPRDRWSRIFPEILRNVLRWKYRGAGNGERTLSNDLFKKLAFGSFCASLRMGAERKRAASIRSFAFSSSAWQTIPAAPLTDFFSRLSSLWGMMVLTHGLKDSDCGSIFALLPVVAEASSSLTALDIRNANETSKYACRCGGRWTSTARRVLLDDAKNCKIAESIGRLEFFRLPRYCTFDKCIGAVTGNPPVGLGPDFVRPRQRDGHDQATSPSHNRARSYRFFLSALPFDVSTSWMLTSSPNQCSRTSSHHILAGCPAIEELTIAGKYVTVLTDLTTAALERHPPLRVLNLRLTAWLSVDALVGFLRRRGGELQVLCFDESRQFDHDFVAAIATTRRGSRRSPSGDAPASSPARTKTTT
ncbi:hypothetical protein BDK51DRAFT_39170 [Blyttiomyces helicus]|uniref:Uncharacterized protein n=1 Tax=Blyttiomyces helicus TaxID=388810 RepID=A0A4P9W6F8_9FUNG|nr:hypothetical protein BDK51DRAFT_39170 [Blyttiomyces helicus]|eukprot:RKO88041.1 hypothetical protein BDK51DRAFT_39170 [Blyttiomyces helicus]